MQAKIRTVKKQTKGIMRVMFDPWLLFLLVTVELFPRSFMNNFKSDISNSSPLSREKTLLSFPLSSDLLVRNGLYGRSEMNIMNSCFQAL